MLNHSDHTGMYKNMINGPSKHHTHHIEKINIDNKNTHLNDNEPHKPIRVQGDVAESSALSPDIPP